MQLPLDNFTSHLGPHGSATNGLLTPPTSTRKRRVPVRHHGNGHAKPIQSRYTDDSCMSDSTDLDRVDVPLKRVRVFNPEYKKMLVSGRGS